MPWVERFWMVWLESLDSSLFNEDFTKIDLVQNPLAREVVEYHYKLAEGKFSASPISPSPSWPGQDFANGELAIVQYGFWFSGGIPLWANDAIKPKIDEGRLVMLPSPTWKGKKRGPTITATASIVTGATKYPDALAEDAVISHQVAEQGYQIRYAPRAEVLVKYPTTYQDWLLQKVRSAGGYVQPFVQQSPVQMRSFWLELRTGLALAVQYPKTMQEWGWMALLLFARLHLWCLIYLKVRWQKQPLALLWKRVETTK